MTLATHRNSVELVAVKSKSLPTVYTEKWSDCDCFVYVQRFLIFAGILLYCAIFPTLYFVGPEFKWFSKADISYAAIMYYLVLNTLLLIGVGYCVVGCVTYPYSNGYFSKTHRRQTNQRFGVEFIKCCERISRLISDMSEN